MNKKIIALLLILLLTLATAAPAIADGDQYELEIILAEPDTDPVEEEPSAPPESSPGTEEVDEGSTSEPVAEPEGPAGGAPASENGGQENEPAPESEHEGTEEGFASEGEEISLIAEYHVTENNPLYEYETVDLSETMRAPYLAEGSEGDSLKPAKPYVTESEAALLVREAMEAREAQSSEFTLELADSAGLTSEQLNALVLEIRERIFNNACGHTGVPTQGDYIRWHWKQRSIKCSAYKSGTNLLLVFRYDMKYYTTSDQERQVGEVVDELVKQTTGMSDYKRLRTLYDYVCENVTYAFTESEISHSAYAAAVLNKAVCQGFASFMYRSLLAMDIDCRLISGTGAGGAHGWNIVELEGQYYYIDATWDRGMTPEYTYFLKGRPFSGHTNDTEFDSDAFYAAYDIASNDYLSTLDIDVYDDIESLAELLEENQTARMMLVSPKDGMNYGQLVRRYSNFTILGDGKRDGRINLLDVGFIVGYLLSSDEKNELKEIVCDVNNDGYVDVTDVSLLARYASGRASSFAAAAA